MQDHIRDLLSRFQYSEQLKETAVFRILFGGEAPSQVMEDLDIHNSYTQRNWVNLYQQKNTDRLDKFTCYEQDPKAGCAGLKAAK